MVTIEASRRDRKKRETRDRIIAEALGVFTRKGIEAATIDEIAAAADVGKGTIYNYFRVKEDIVVAFLVDIERDVQREVASWVRRRGALDSTLTRLIQRQFELKGPHHAFVRVFLAQLCARATPTSDWVREIQTVIDPPLVQLFTTFQKRGLVRRDIDVATLVSAFKVMHLGLMVLWAILGPSWAPVADAVRAQVRLFCSGIEART
jgi:AcrR family transcriptional regulator